MQLLALYRQTIRQLEETAIETASLDARLLLQAALQMDDAAWVSERQRQLTLEEQQKVQQYIARRRAREPVAHILGYKSFWRDDFAVSAEVLSPRPDSETLIAMLLDYFPDRQQPYHILDLGTGSGCLLLSLLREFPQAMGMGIDASTTALSVAETNANRLNLHARACFQHGNWMQTLQTRYDMIISNPPYIRSAAIAGLEPEVKQYEPLLALSGGDDGLEAYRQIIPALPNHLASGGIAVIELGDGQSDAVASLVNQTQCRVLEIRCDYSGIKRGIAIA